MIGQPGYQQCYTLVISQPPALSVYTSVNNIDKTVEINLNGGQQYTIQFNNKSYTTTASQLILPLLTGNNTLTVVTDKSCQGIFNKMIVLGGQSDPFPNPVSGVLTIDMGDDKSVSVNATISDKAGKKIYSSQLANNNGKLYIDFSNIESGVYILSITTSSSRSMYKILRK